jgi:serine/arginine repetitive matrix protein 2
VLNKLSLLVNNHEREQELNREREREWNKPHPHPKTPELHHRHSYSHGSKSGGTRSASPMLNLTNRLGRRGSVTSLKSLDDGRSSRTSSFGSQAECEHNPLSVVFGEKFD